MTCVVGVRGGNGVLLAGDTQGSTMWAKRERKDAKTYALSRLVAIAYCGSYRLGQLLTYHMTDLEDPPLGRDEHRWAVREFIPHLREVVFEHGLLKVHHNVECLDESAFLLAVRGRLMYVDSDFQVGEDVLPFAALGSGEDVAIGAMMALAGRDPEPLDDSELRGVAEAGIRAAADLTPFVGGAITTTSTVVYTDEERELAREIVGDRADGFA